MGSRWESIIVAIGLIALFYFVKKYYWGKKSPLLKQKQKPKSSIPKKTQIKEQKSLKIELQKLNLKKQSYSSSTHHMASLLMHPHSLESARKEFLDNAQKFRGSYESLFLTCQGRMNGFSREQILRNWEEGIRSTEAKFLILIWTTIIQKHCGRNFYFEILSFLKRDPKIENEILQEWLKQLFKWGLVREPKGQISIPETDEKLKGGEIQTARWFLNGKLLEEWEGQVKSLGH
jgi:hypothetical protein